MSDSGLDVEVDEAVAATRCEAYWSVAHMGGRPQFAGECATATCETPDATVMSWALIDPNGVIHVDSMVLPRPCVPLRHGGDVRAARSPSLAALGVTLHAVGSVGAFCWLSDSAWHPVPGFVSLAASFVGLYLWGKR